MNLNGASINAFGVNESCHAGNATSVKGVVQCTVTATVRARKLSVVRGWSGFSISVYKAEVTNRFSEVSAAGVVSCSAFAKAISMGKHLGVSVGNYGELSQSLPVRAVNALRIRGVVGFSTVSVLPVRMDSMLTLSAKWAFISAVDSRARLRFWRRSKCYARVSSVDPAKRRIIPVCGCES